MLLLPRRFAGNISGCPNLASRNSIQIIEKRIDEGTYRAMVKPIQLKSHTVLILDWLGGRIYTRPLSEHAISKHMKQIRVSREVRAARSHVFGKRTATRSGD